MQTETTTQTETQTGGDAGQPWFSALPENLRADPSITKFKSLEDLAAGYVGLQKLMGHPKDKLAVIPDDPSEREKLAAKLWGFPDDPEKYSPALPEDLPADYRDPKKAPGLDWFTGIAKELRLPPNVAGRLYGEYVKFAQKAAADQKANAEAEQVRQFEAVKQAWGENFERNAAAANQALANLDRLLEANGNQGPKLAEVLDKAGLASHPTVVNAMLALSKFFREDTISGTSKPAASQASTRADELLRKSIELLGSNPEEAKRLAREAAELRLMASKGA